MPEGQWEVVARGNKKEKPVTNGKPKGKDDKRKLLENGPKLEDILPPSQIKSLFAAMEADEKKSGKEKENKKEKKEGESKKQQQKKQAAAEKKPDPPKPKPPKSIEAAFQAMDPNEFANLVNSNKARFANAPLVWLKEIAAYLNSKTALDVQDVIFSSQSVNYPLNIVPAEIRKTVESVLKDAGPQNSQLFYDGTLTALANDMSRGQSSIGHKVLIQMLAQESPELCVTAIQKSRSVWNSYQNRPPIGLSLLWSFGQGGFKNLAVGLQVWNELFLPLIELRHYSKYVLSYLSKLLDRHVKMDSKVTLEQYVSLFDAVAARKTLSKEATSDLIKQLSKIRKIYFKSTPKLQVTFNQLLKKLPSQYTSSNNLDALHNELVSTLVECLQKDDTCNATWRQLYHKCPKQTATLLHFIDANWRAVSPALKLGVFRSTLEFFQKQNTEKKQDEISVRVDQLCQEMGKKMKKQARGFPWLGSSLALLAAIVGLLIYDVTSAGTLSKSATGKLLNDAGLLEQTQLAWKRTLVTSARGYVWVENNAPVYYAQAAEYSKPYGELAKDLFLIASEQVCRVYNNTRNYVVETAPAVGAAVEVYAPGLLGTISDYYTAGSSAVVRFSSVYYASGREYLQSKVFVGEWAPEVLQDKTFKALNSTRTAVSEYYDWFHKQVHQYSETQ